MLKHGQASRYAPYFDIDWNAEDEALRGKVLLPVLGKPLREVLDAGEITLARERGRLGRALLRAALSDRRRSDAGDDRPRTRCWRGSTIGSRGGASPMTRSTGGASSTSTSSPACAWSTLPAFEDVHALIFRLYAEGLIDGVRVDHVDGLADPAGYCRRAASRLDALRQRPTSRRATPISWWRRSCCAARHCRPTGNATAPAATTS